MGEGTVIAGMSGKRGNNLEGGVLAASWVGDLISWCRGDVPWDAVLKGGDARNLPS